LRSGYPLRKGYRLTLSLILILAIYSITFMALMSLEGQKKNATPGNAIYWVFQTMTTLGYGDIVFKTTAGHIFTIIVTLTGIAILWAIVVPFVFTPSLVRLIEAPPNSAPEKISDHIIICGYNPIVETLIDRLSMLKVPFLIIERSEEVARSIYKRYPVVWGDPSEKEVLTRASVSFARLFIANEEDELNADVILTLREISDIEVIAIVDDLSRSRFLCYAGASRIISPKTLLGTFIAQITAPPEKNVFPGAIRLFGELLLVQLPIYPGAALIGCKLNEQFVKDTGACIVGVWQRGLFNPHTRDDEPILSNSVLMVVGDKEQLSRIRDLTVGTRKEGPLIILGYGDVGRMVAKALSEYGISPLIVDKRDLEAIPFEHITGDATLEINLIGANVREAVGVLILLNKDSDAIYAALLAKNLNPNAFVVARANRVKSAEKIYRAGADYVASVPIVASHMLAKIIQDEEEELSLLYEDLELELFTVGKKSDMAGRTLAEIDLPVRFGCRPVALERKGQAMAMLESGTLVESGDILALIGSQESIEAFNHAYDQKPALERMLKIPRRAKF